MTFSISNRRYHIVFATVVALATIQLCRADIFTALAEMEELLETEAVLIANLEQYVEAQEQRLGYLRR